MELEEVERCCCVVKVFEAFSSKKNPVSCSGVLVHPPTRTVICSGFPFSRFITDKEPFSENVRFLSPKSFSDKLQIRLSFPPERDVDSEKTSTPNRTRHPGEVSAELLMLVGCPEFKQAFRTVFRDAEQWRFHGDPKEDGDGDAAEEEEEELTRDAHLLSWFAVLRVSVSDDRAGTGLFPRTLPWLNSSCLRKGRPVVACGSPFGSLCVDLFMGTLSRGIVSNLAGEDNALILTDARCLPGTEGGGLFATTNGVDDASLVGLIVSPFGWKANEWIGLTLVCSVHSILRSVLRCVDAQDPLQDAWIKQRGEEAAVVCVSTTAEEAIDGRYPTVCFVDSGPFWGSGVVVAPRLVVTCRHVVNGRSTVNLKFHHRDRVHDVVGDVLFSTKASSPFDLALVQLRGSVKDAVVPRMAQSFNLGESVVALGYGALGRRCGPSLTGGVLSKALSLSERPVMLQTTCAVQAGASGGAVVRAHTGELLGIVSSNTRDTAAKVTYPHLNFSIPVTVFHRLLRHFEHTGDVSVFKALDTTEAELRRVWRLQGAPSKL